MVSDEISFLERESGADTTRREDPMWMRGIKYGFVTVIEGCMDIAQHLCASQGWGPPADNGHAVALLGEHGVVSRELGGTMRRAVGFRNVLVHEYVEVQDAVVVERLERLGDLRSFVASVSQWMTRG